MCSHYLGFDVARYPGDGVMAWLWTHNVRISGFYLNHHSGGSDPSWLTRRQVLVAAGWGLAPLYLGWQTVTPDNSRRPPPTDPDATASHDAAEAAGLMQSAGFAPGTVIYVDVEDGTVPTGTYEAYLLALADGIKRRGFQPALYCSHRCAAWAVAAGLACWSFNIPNGSYPTLDPGNLPPRAIDQDCVGTQFAQNVHLAGLPVAIDLNWFSVPDPSIVAAPPVA